jgi:hypothetical protein
MKLSQSSRWAILATLVFFLGSTLGAPDAEAKRKKRKKRRAAIAKVSEAKLAQVLGDYDLGMSKSKVLKVIKKGLREQYAEKISATSDVFRQDKLRRERGAKLKSIGKTFIEFKGKKSGWDVSIIDDQFLHNRGESMMLYDEYDVDAGVDQRRFFFFHEGKLYKMVVALSSDKLKKKQRNFAFMKSFMEGQFGRGTIRNRIDGDDKGKPYLLEWMSSRYHVFAIDKMSFYNTFSLGIADRAIQAEVVKAGGTKRKVLRASNITKSVIEDGNSAPTLDEGNSDVLDGLIGD